MLYRKSDACVYILFIAALHALVSSLAPAAREQGKLNDAQVTALSAKLDQILGNVADGPVERRNEKGEVRNCSVYEPCHRHEWLIRAVIYLARQ